MNTINVESLNEIFNIDGPAWIECDPSTWVETRKSPEPVCARMERTKEWRENIAKSNTGKTHMKGKCCKVWEVTFESGDVEYVYDGLPMWCEKNGYSWSKVRDLSRGKAKRTSGLVSVIEVAQGKWQTPLSTL
jgi:hypothetical protein